MINLTNELFQRKPDTKSNPPPILVKFQRWKDKTKIFYKRKILPAQYMIDEDLTPKQTYDKSKLEAYAKMVCIQTLVNSSSDNIFRHKKKIKQSNGMVKTCL